MSKMKTIPESGFLVGPRSPVGRVVRRNVFLPDDHIWQQIEAGIEAMNYSVLERSFDRMLTNLMRWVEEYNERVSG